MFKSPWTYVHRIDGETPKARLGGGGEEGGGGEYLGSGRWKYNAGLDQGVLPH